jgi:hypothetical protein
MKNGNETKACRGRKADTGFQDRRAALLLERLQNDPSARDKMVYQLAMHLQSEETAQR